MTTIQTPLPESLAHYEQALDALFKAMVYKLERNSSKESPSRPDINTLVARLVEEVAEVLIQLAEDRYDVNMLHELADVANYCMLIYVASHSPLSQTLMERIAEQKAKHGYVNYQEL